MEKTFAIIRVSSQDQLKGYGPDSQWSDDVVPNAKLLGLEVREEWRRVIQEPATSWDREKFATAVQDVLDLYRRGVIGALIFPRVDRETRFLFGSFPLLCEVIHVGMKVYFARERLRLDPDDSESVSRYLQKAQEARAYVETMRTNTVNAKRRRAEKDHMMPTAHSKWAHDYHPFRKDWGQIRGADSGRFTVNTEKAAWVKKWAQWILEEGLSTNKCRRRMNEQYGIKIHRTTIVDVLSDPAMVGKFYAYRTKDVKGPKGRRKVMRDEKDWVLVYEDPQQAILSPEQFYALKEKFQLNRQNSPRHTKHWYPPLRSLIFHSCGRRMTGTYSGGRPVYRCVPCGAQLKAGPLWDEIRAGVTAMLLDSNRLVPAIKSQMNSGQSVSRLEQEIKDVNQRLNTLEDAEAKALRLHLYLVNYPVQKLEAEQKRIEEMKKEAALKKAKIEQQLADLRRAMVDEEGLRRFCEVAARNLDELDDARWRVLLETMRLQVHVNGDAVTVRVAVPLMNDPESVIVSCTCPCS
ncbi:MAG: recombinase family protein [Dehalococcoidia bacterium]|nr:recombinase family protein [Dehalococcoidia bacterium]